MIAEKDATWKVEVIESKTFAGSYYWFISSHNDIGTGYRESYKYFNSRDKAIDHFKEYAKLNNITKYKIVGENGD